MNIVDPLVVMINGCLDIVPTYGALISLWGRIPRKYDDLLFPQGRTSYEGTENYTST
jgi:hypothetical protein